MKRSPNELRCVLLAAMAALSSASRGAEPPLHPTLRYQASWIGNSFGDGKKWIQKDAMGLAVGPDGTCYVPSSWDEAGKGLGFYRDGQPIGQCQRIKIGDGGVAVDDKYIYSPTPERVNGKTATRLLRWTLDGKVAPLVHGSNEFPHDFDAWIAGVCAYRGEVFVQDAAANTIQVFDRETLAETRSFPCDRPYRLAIDKQGFLWVLKRANDIDLRHTEAAIVQYTLDGKPTGKSIAGINGAMAVAAGPNGRLLVAGPNNQVLAYDVSGAKPVIVDVLGVKGGVFAGPNPGLMGPDRLFGLVGVGADDTGAIYTAGRSYAAGGSFDLRKFAPGGKLVWQLTNQGFTDCAAVDPASDGRDVYTRAEHFRLDLSKPPGKQWTWQGYTLNPANDDGRMDMAGFNWSSPILKRLRGRLYMYERPGDYIGVFRQGPGEEFVPSAVVDIAAKWLVSMEPNDRYYHFLVWPPSQPNPRVRWDWRDLNGNGKADSNEFESYPQLIDEIGVVLDSCVDDMGNIWLCGVASGGARTLWQLPLRGFDPKDNPIYKLADLVRIPLPPEFNSVNRLSYVGGDDTMYLSGETIRSPRSIHGGTIGTEVIRYDHWSTPARTLRWRITVPSGKPSDDPGFICLAVAGDRIFLMQRYWCRIWTYDAATGSYLGSITTTPDTGIFEGCDMHDGISVFQRAEGDYLIFAEDDYMPKIRLYDVPRQECKPRTPPPATE